MTLVDASSAHHLKAAFDSAPFCDVHLVVDTSPDKTDVRRAVDVLAESILGRSIVVQPWPWQDDFSAARNHILHQAAALAAARPGPCWGVVLDSDERFVCADAAATRAEFASCDPGVQGVHVYDIDNFYTKERCFRLPSSARYVGPTHEVAIHAGQASTFHSWRFWELGKTPEQVQAKLVRDERLLRAHTKRNPKDARWWYYLADTLCNLGKQQEAFETFMRCAGLRAWDEESAWACYRAATIQVQQEKYHEAVETCAKGIARHPGMGELPWLAAVAAFRAQMPEKAAWWASLSIAVGSHVGVNVNERRIGFRHLPALYELPYDILRNSLPTEAQRAQAESDFWAAKLHRYGGSSFEEVALRRNSDNARAEARNDIGRKLKPLGELVDGVRMHQLPNPSTTGYHAMNPSICWHQGRLLAVIRTVNYTIDGAGNYVAPPEDAGVIKTENYLVDVDPDSLDVSNARPILDKTGGQRFPTLVRGYEDMRLISVGDRLMASATVRDHAAHTPVDTVICELDGSDIVREWVQPSDRPEKNWMPLVRDGQLCFLYSLDPTIVRQFDSATGRCAETASSIPALGLDHLRGGSQLVPYDNGWLAVTHEVAYLDERRRYLHRFVQFDSQLCVVCVSRSWTLRPHLGIEFVAGIATWHDTLIMSVGIEDREAWLVTLPFTHVSDGPLNPAYWTCKTLAP